MASFKRTLVLPSRQRLLSISFPRLRSGLLSLCSGAAFQAGRMQGGKPELLSERAANRSWALKKHCSAASNVTQPTFAQTEHFHENRPRKVAERTIHTSSGHVHNYIGGFWQHFSQSIETLCDTSCFKNI